ncbi:hypothetical protein ACETK3_20270 [Arthrobacter sp. E44]|uniref:hypothetical protein n=1 Tax=Arthrobacter sp. E44 TaxID=3341794 RepID=UPI0035A71E31
MTVGLRNFLSRRRVPAAEEFPAVVVPAADEREPLSPAQLADLEAAWAELRQAADETGMTSFHACTRDGSRWEENPNSLRAMANAIRSTQN